MFLINSTHANEYGYFLDQTSTVPITFQLKIVSKEAKQLKMNTK